jgi:hypothetical protein
MAYTITLKNLQAVVDRINTTTGSPVEQYTKTEDGKLVANIGNYHLSGAYGGYALHRMVNASGGITDVSQSGHVSKRALYDLLHMYLAGYEAGKGETV